MLELSKQADVKDVTEQLLDPCLHQQQCQPRKGMMSLMEKKPRRKQMKKAKLRRKLFVVFCCDFGCACCDVGYAETCHHHLGHHYRRHRILHSLLGQIPPTHLKNKNKEEAKEKKERKREKQKMKAVARKRKRKDTTILQFRNVWQTAVEQVIDMLHTTNELLTSECGLNKKH
jgi:mRNA deadenylase 3'-5' endonuclease subunit Ccr4